MLSGSVKATHDADGLLHSVANIYTEYKKFLGIVTTVSSAGHSKNSFICVKKDRMELRAHIFDKKEHSELVLLSIALGIEYGLMHTNDISKTGLIGWGTKPVIAAKGTHDNAKIWRLGTFMRDCTFQKDGSISFEKENFDMLFDRFKESGADLTPIVAKNFADSDKKIQLDRYLQEIRIERSGEKVRVVFPQNDSNQKIFYEKHKEVLESIEAKQIDMLALKGSYSSAIRARTFRGVYDAFAQKFWQSPVFEKMNPELKSALATSMKEAAVQYEKSMQKRKR